MKKNNMVYGIIGVGVRNGNYNASFDRTPKQNSLGEMYASPQCLGFAIKEQLNKEGCKILYRKSIGEKGVRKLEETFEHLTETKLDAKKMTENDVKEIMFKQFIDIRLFGCTFAVAPNFGIKGAIQIGMGFNKYEDTEILISELLAPFAAEKKEKKNDEDKQSNTLGEQIIVDEAHYVHGFTIDPYEYEQYIGMVKDFEGFTDEDYAVFKNASLISVSNYNSKSKAGCQNEFSIFVETNNDVKNLINLNAMEQYITIYKENKVVYDLTELSKILNDIKDNIKSVEIYYNPYTLEIKHNLDAKIYSIITRKEI